MNLEFNRSFKYGDGIFESVRLLNGKVAFLNEHFERLIQSFEILGLEKPQPFSSTWFESEINMATSAMDQHADSPFWRVRMTFWRNAPGLYFPENNNCSWHVEATALTSENFTLNSTGLNIGICRDIKLACDMLSPLKSSSALPYVMAAIERKKMSWDDAIMLNCYDRVAEAVSSNIFILIGHKLYSPPLSEGPVNGVMRRVIMEHAGQLGLSVIESAIAPRLIYNADEIWLSNAIKGLQWVQSIQGLDHKYAKVYAEQMLPLLNQIALKNK